MRLISVQWIFIIILTATTVAAAIDAGKSRARLSERQATEIVDRALAITPFSAPVTIQSVNPSTREVVFTMFNTRLGTEANFLARVKLEALIVVFQPITENNVIVGFKPRESLTLDELLPGVSGVANLAYDKEGTMHLDNLILGVGTWDR
ncbi:MAG: hypothetical protein JW384_03726 [Nitrosomonadaceae bacterium]|nr:hypothetical protein [Nitrosomonadaceae bacterium]